MLGYYLAVLGLILSESLCVKLDSVLAGVLLILLIEHIPAKLGEEMIGIK